MSVKFNGKELSIGSHHMFNGFRLDRIIFNDVTVWEHDMAPHNAVLNNDLIKNISTNHTHNHTNGKDWNNSGRVYNYYILSETSGTYVGEGLWAEATASYSATIDLTVLPNYQQIKRVEIGRYGYGTLAVKLTSGQTSINISDYSRGAASNSYFSHGPGETWGVSAKAGISSVKYYYDTGHVAPLSVCTRTSYSGSLSSDGYSAERHESRTYTGTGFSISTSASWAGTIDLTKLPDWRNIKKVEITHPRYNGHEGTKASAVTTHEVTSGQTSISFSDYSSQSNDTNGGGVWGKIGNDCKVHAIAGVQQIVYYYE